MQFNHSRFRNSLFLLALGIILSVINIYFDHDLFEMFVDFIHQYEEHDLDEILLLLVPLVLGLVIDLLNEKQHKQHKLHLIEEERLKALKATMNTVHDINNNFLNAMVYFVSEAKENKQLSDNSIKEIDKLIYKTAEQLKLLSNITHTNETDYGQGIKGIDYKSGQKTSDQ